LKEVENQNPDCLVITGDITSLATEEEFSLAMETLKPVLQKFKDRVLLLPGNHDVLTQDAVRDKLFEKAFSNIVNHSLSEYPIEVRFNNIRLIGLNPCVPNRLLSTGTYPQNQLDKLKQLLSKPSELCTVLASHYPILDHKDQLYHQVDAYHSASNGQSLVDVLNGAECKPSLFIHGHIHKGYITKLSFSKGIEMIHANPGSSGFTHLKIGENIKSYAAYNIYALDSVSKPLNGSSNSEDKCEHHVKIERFVHNGNEFVKGQYAAAT